MAKHLNSYRFCKNDKISGPHFYHQAALRALGVTILKTECTSFLSVYSIHLGNADFSPKTSFNYMNLTKTSQQ